MPRDDLSIDFVKRMAPSAEAQDPATILEDWTHRTQNLPEELRFIQDEILDKDRAYNDCVKTIEDCDLKIQRWIRANGSHHPNPRENQLRETIRANFTKADQLAAEKIHLAEKLKRIYDKHLKHLDGQIELLVRRSEPGFENPDEIPSTLRPSAANHSNTSVRILAASSQPLNPILNNSSTPSSTKAPAAVRAALSQAHPSSAPATPAASMLLNRNQREHSAGPGTSSVPKRVPRANTGLPNAPAASSGLARHASMGPGTPKGGTPSVSRAGSVAPRPSNKTASFARKTTPSGAISRKKPPNGKSTLSRVKRAANSKGSPASTADSELSDAESIQSSARGSRAGSGTPVPQSQKRMSPSADHDGDEDMADRDPDGSVSGGSDDEEEDEEGKKYCLCQHVSYGDMVACDNPSCRYEWFHWNCVGLKSEPEGRWFCPPCTEIMSRKKGK